MLEITIVLMLATIAYILYQLDRIYTVLKWIIQNVHIVPNNVSNDEALKRVQRVLGLDDSEKDSNNIDQ